MLIMLTLFYIAYRIKRFKQMQRNAKIQKVHFVEELDELDFKLMKLCEVQEMEEDEIKTISDDLTDSENEIITEEDLHMLPLDYETDDEYVYDNLECNDKLKSEAKTNLHD